MAWRGGGASRPGMGTWHGPVTRKTKEKAKARKSRLESQWSASGTPVPGGSRRFPGLLPGPRQARPRLGEDEKCLRPGELRALMDLAAKKAGRERMRGMFGPRWRDYVLLELLASTGLRASEAARLKIEDMVLIAEDPYLRVVGGKSRSGRDVDTVPVPPMLASHLKDWLEHRKIVCEPKDPLFLRTNGQDMDRKDVWETVKRLVRGSGLRSSISPHSFRHFYITELARRPGASPMNVARLARLRSLDLVTRYFHASQLDLRKMVAELPVPSGRGLGRKKRQKKKAPT